MNTKAIIDDKTNMSSHSISYAQAIYEATYQEMARDENVFVFGMGVDDPKGTLGTTLNLHKEFGSNRCFDTPLSEDAMTGVAIGAAIAGLRPIHVHMRMDFLLLCMNQLVNIAAKSSYMFGGSVSVPIVVRATIGRSWGQGAQHSQALHAQFMHIPGIKVVAPVTPHDAKGCLIAAIRDNNPVLFIEHRMLYNMKGVVVKDSYEVPLGKARTLSVGKDITIVAISHMVVEVLRAKALLEQDGISVEVIDPVTLSPLDFETIISSVVKTGRLLVVDNAWLTCGASAEIIANVVEGIGCKSGQNIQCARLGFASVPCPTTKSLENLFYQNPVSITEKVYEMVIGRKKKYSDTQNVAKEILEFKGPF